MSLTKDQKAILKAIDRIPSFVINEAKPIWDCLQSEWKNSKFKFEFSFSVVFQWVFVASLGITFTVSIV